MRSETALERKAAGNLTTTVIPRQWVWTGLVLAAAAVCGYLLASRQLIGTGFPLDDAWIHQTYARNLAQFGEWSFIAGRPSAGSTAPLWSFLLALGYGLGLPLFSWAFLLGALCLLGLGLAGEVLLRSYCPKLPGRIPWACLFLVGEWRLVWAAVSGMETLLSGLLVLLVLALAGRARGRNWGWVGLLISLSVWVRPDGLTLLGPAGFILLFAEPDWRQRARSLIWLSAGLAVLVVPYLAFNWVVQGSLWPNTFYAKQAEYAVLREVPLLLRFFREVSLPLIGSGLLLLPGFVTFTVQAWKTRRWPVLAAVIWFLGYGFIYALRLPVTYQYGRYFMPAMPVYFVIGLAGLVILVRELRTTRVRRILRQAWVLSLTGLWIGFYLLGAGRYAQDVAVIETEMVATARWVAANTEPGDLVAAHDIGALGYFAGRDLVDLAGLISPEVIPFIRDEDRLRSYMDEQQVDYLVVFPDWYTRLAAGKDLVFQSGGTFSIQQGGSNMWVYRW